MFQSGFAAASVWLILYASAMRGARMASTMEFAGELVERGSKSSALKGRIHESISDLFGWIEENDYRAYDTFDGLSSPLLRPLTFETILGRTVLLQGVRRFPLNLRPLLGIKRSRSTKGMGFLARGFMRLHQSTGDAIWIEKARY